MSFKKLILCGLAGTIAAVPSPSAADVTSRGLSERLYSVLMDTTPVPVSDTKNTGFYWGQQDTFACGSKMTMATESAFACLQYRFDGPNNEMVIAQDDPMELSATVHSGVHSWVMKDDEKRNGKMAWTKTEPMKVNDDNTFDLVLGNWDETVISVKDRSYLDTFACEDYYEGRDNIYLMKGTVGDYNLLCMYAVIPTCD
eukprot:Clim_evm3s134 gene=Clim_evmTU3s134